MFFYKVGGWEVNLLLIIVYFICNLLIFKLLDEYSRSHFFTNKRDQWKIYRVTGCCF
jgi:hypothetical protein